MMGNNHEHDQNKHRQLQTPNDSPVSSVLRPLLTPSPRFNLNRYRLIPISALGFPPNQQLHVRPDGQLGFREISLPAHAHDRVSTVQFPFPPDQQLQLVGNGQDETEGIGYEDIALAAEELALAAQAMEMERRSPYNMRQQNLIVLKPPLKVTGAGTPKISTMPYTSPAKSLDLLRQNIQRTINQDIMEVINKYMERFFRPAIENIRANSAGDPVSDDHISNMCRNILEEAKKMYPVHPLTPSPSSLSSSTNSSAIEHESSDYSQSHQIQISSDQTKVPHSSPPFGIKRESDDNDSEASALSNPAKKPKKSTKGQSNKSNAVAAKNTTTSPARNAAASNKPKKPSGPSKKHVAGWDLTKFTTQTLFIMGAKANKALGFAQTRGRLYVKHPALFKYASDADDKEWLSKNKLMPATGGRAYIMLLEDIEKLARDNKLNATINYDDIQGFRVPDFLLNKMRTYIGSLKKQHAEDTPKVAPNRKNQHNGGINNPVPNSTMLQVTSAMSTVSTSQVPNSSLIQVAASSSMSSTGPRMNDNSAILAQLNPSQAQQLPQMHSQPIQTALPSHHPLEHNPHHTYHHLPPNSTLMYESNLMTLNSVPQQHQQHDLTDIQEYIQLEKAPMYPGHPTQGIPNQNEQSHAIQHLSNAIPEGYAHSPHLDTLENSIAKEEEWSNRSLLQYALQGTRTLGWDPQEFQEFEGLTHEMSGGNGSNVAENSSYFQ